MEYDAKFVKCPYYVENNSKHQIATNQTRCAGVDDVDIICLFFKDRDSQLRHKIAFCYSIDGYHKCPVAKELDKRWDEKT